MSVESAALSPAPDSHTATLPESDEYADLSAPARIMAIADIFEALSACDRPYKRGKTLSAAIKIMSFMKKDEHIDRFFLEVYNFIYI